MCNAVQLMSELKMHPADTGAQPHLSNSICLARWGSLLFTVLFLGSKGQNNHEVRKEEIGEWLKAVTSGLDACL